MGPRECVGLVPGDVHDGRAGLELVHAVEAPLASVVDPLEGPLDPLALAPLPAGWRPPAAPRIPAGLDEAQPIDVRDR